jgi:Ulp1 family protease
MSPLQMIQRLKSDPSFDFENPLKSLEEKNITMVTEKPEQVTLTDIKKTMNNTNWADTRVIDWWLAYWCDLHATNTFFTQAKQETSYRSMPNPSSLIQNKIVCVSSMWLKSTYQTDKDELYIFDIFQCTKLLIPVNLSEVHWVLACITINGNRIAIEWYDSLHNGSTDQKDVLTVQTAKLTEWLNRKNKARNTTSSGAATTAATPPLEITSCAARRARDQTNGVDCGFWVCMYAAYLCIGIPCDIKEEMSKGSMNINHVRSWMIHCMDERGRQADGGQSNKVQVPSEPNHAHTS